MTRLIEQRAARSFGQVRRRRRAVLAAVSGAAFIALLPPASAHAETCAFDGGPQFGGIEPALTVNATCADPDYNETSLVIDSTESKALDLPDGTKVGYTEVRGHFPATRTRAQLPEGITQSPTTAQHGVVWRFPEKKYWRNRFFQQTYPLVLEDLNMVDDRFAFVDGGGYIVGTIPGSPIVGYRVSAASAKLAKAYANRLYANTNRIYGYLYGQSGGSVQSMGANEGTTGVWDGIVPVVIATDGLNTHSFMWNGFYALAVPTAKREAIADAAAVASGGDIRAGLNGEERAALDELLDAGFPRIVLETMQFSPGSAAQLAGPVRNLDPTYEDDFWSKPGYEGAQPPAYLAAAKIDGMARITAITRTDEGVPAAIAFDPATIPALGSIGATGLQFYPYAADGTTRLTQGDAVALSGKLDGATLRLDDGRNDPSLIAALAVGGKVRINNRFLLAAMFYPRHSILPDNPAYDQYLNADGTPKHVQRAATGPIPVPYINNLRSSGGRLETGHLKVKTMVIENLADGASYPYVGGLYAEKVRKAMGRRAADGMFRLYYQENAVHGASLAVPPGKLGVSTASVGGILHQALLDLADWAERGIAPLPSTPYRRDASNQVIVPAKASERLGHQPVMHLAANGGERAEVATNAEVTLSATMEMPPRAGRIVQYDWYMGGADYRFEPATKLAAPRKRVTVTRKISFPQPGEYVVTLRAAGQRDGLGDAGGATALVNIDRVRVIVRGDGAGSATTRPDAAIVRLDPAFWHVDIMTKGSRCVIDPANVTLRRADASKSARLRAFGPANSPSTIVDFVAGANTAAVDPSAFPVRDGLTMTIADAATGATLSRVDFAVLPSLPNDWDGLANALEARGCTAQIARLADLLPNRR